jgi:hypothetical protein
LGACPTRPRYPVSRSIMDQATPTVAIIGGDPWGRHYIASTDTIQMYRRRMAHRRPGDTGLARTFGRTDYPLRETIVPGSSMRPAVPACPRRGRPGPRDCPLKTSASVLSPTMAARRSSRTSGAVSFILVDGTACGIRRSSHMPYLKTRPRRRTGPLSSESRSSVAKAIGIRIPESSSRPRVKSESGRSSGVQSSRTAALEPNEDVCHVGA